MQRYFVNLSSLVGNRLQEERSDRSLSQAEAGALAGVSREMWGRYERGALPGGDVLLALANAGFDALYILTGRREPPPDLTAEEIALVHKLRAAPAHIKATVHTVLGATAPDTPSGPQIQADKIGTVSTGKIGKIVQNL